MGNWKLVRERRGEPELYNLQNDIGETLNLAETEPEMVKNIQAAYAEWDNQMIAAKWIRQDQNNAEVGGKLKTGSP